MLWSFVAATIAITGCMVFVSWMVIGEERRRTGPETKKRPETISKNQPTLR